MHFATEIHCNNAIMQLKTILLNVHFAWCHTCCYFSETELQRR